jgi:hypothetical protein
MVTAQIAILSRTRAAWIFEFTGAPARLSDAYDVFEKRDYDVVGEPVSEADARALAANDKYEFQK